MSHVRDARSLLMLKLLFINRRDGDATPLLRAQREQFSAQADRLAAAVEESEGFDRALLLWRFHITTAAMQFTETHARRPNCGTAWPTTRSTTSDT